MNKKKEKKKPTTAYSVCLALLEYIELPIAYACISYRMPLLMDYFGNKLLNDSNVYSIVGFIAESVTITSFHSNLAPLQHNQIPGFTLSDTLLAAPSYIRLFDFNFIFNIKIWLPCVLFYTRKAGIPTCIKGD